MEESYLSRGGSQADFQKGHRGTETENQDQEIIRHSERPLVHWTHPEDKLPVEQEASFPVDWDRGSQELCERAQVITFFQED